MKYRVKQLVCDYAVICEDTNLIICICNIRKNAELIADILNADNDRRAIFYGLYPNAKYKIIPNVNKTRQKKENIDCMRDELDKYCYSFVVCEQNGRRCPLYGYCRTHGEFMNKDIKKLYDRMKLETEAADGEKD